MKKILFALPAMLTTGILLGQTYPDPEFSNEIYLLKKDAGYSLLRLEKSNTAMDTKTKLAGFGGSESSYTIEGEKSTVRFTNGSDLAFVFATISQAIPATGVSDSMMKANGMDPSMMQGINNMFDPANTITLYKTESANGNRKILLQKSPGALPFGSKKIRSSEKFSFSIKKVRDGYWVMYINKTLPPGEYAFTMMNMMNPGDMMGGGMGIFAFAID